MPAERKQRSRLKETIEKENLAQRVKNLEDRVASLEDAVGTGKMILGGETVYEVLADLRRRVGELEQRQDLKSGLRSP